MALRLASPEVSRVQPHFPQSRSRIIKIALGVHDTLDITIGARSPAPSSQSKSRLEKWSAFGRHILPYRSAPPLDVRQLPTFN